MTSLSVLDSDAVPQTMSPLFTRLPAELRLRVYTFVSVGCQATVWFDGEFGEKWRAWRSWGRRERLAKDGQCCYNHSGGGFALLMTCRMVYIEAFQTYWSETALSVTRSLQTSGWYRGCELQQVCARLPVAIKANLGHLRNTRLPRIENDTPTDDDTIWAPTLLEQFPRLVTCAFHGWPPLPKVRDPPYTSGLPDSGNVASVYRGVGPFHLKDGESPKAYLERRFGIQQSCRIIFLSTTRGFPRKDPPKRYEQRYQYFNYATGLVFQTTTPPPYGDGFEEILRAEKGSEWSYERYYD
ncbi:hypothetical protein INS49_003462 [Diaporthe citri]|uniref:uncharacterized protein n=1 Tax=Diaporthe citri TaxID=83186 RepID=UPI001C7FA9D4|nr:uncharacterized protein INS49_003462 [Diaporthe citri]KAG6355500.1 hypothetical protein INS49_003462 [Diaporthe citri]